MAQRSRKNHIVDAVLPLFLENGFKGTSIDMVVKACGVSKPTVYNHFADKTALFTAALELWIEQHKPAIVPVRGSAGLNRLVRENWLSDDAVRLYALVIGEGYRFPAARRLFWEHFDRRWRSALGYLCDHDPGLERAEVERRLDRMLLESLSSR